MSLQATNLYIQAAQLPATFTGTPNEFLAEIVKRMRIVSPTGTNFIYTGDTEPASNVGPWLRNGTQWWVWDATTKKYVPIDLSASVTIPFFIGNSLPSGNNPPVWLKTTKDATDQSPLDFGDPLGWFLWNGSAWIPIFCHIGSSFPVSTDPPIWLKTTKDWAITDQTYGDPLTWMMFNGTSWQPVGAAILSAASVGPTANRPAAPSDFQVYYDTDIACLIWWERSMWRTVSGVRGDVKAVTAVTSTEALTQNPGWTLLADPTGAVNWAGRIPAPATKEPGGAIVQTPDTNVESHPRGDILPLVIDSNFLTNNALTGTSKTPMIYLWHLYKL